MRFKLLAGVVTVLAFLVPVAPAQAATPGLDGSCQPIERKEYKNLRTLIDIDLDTATDIEVRVRANQILAAARAESLPSLPTATQKALDGPAVDLREFLKTGMQKAWSEDLLAVVSQTAVDAGPQVKAAATKVLDEKTVEASLAYLNNGLYAARELDCQPKPSVTISAAPGGGLPLTGSSIPVLIVGAVALIASGIGAMVLARRLRA